MHIQTPLTALTLLSTAAGQPHPRRRCTSDDACWPTAQTWTEFNATVGGRLIRSVPSAAVCHGSRYNADQCATAKGSWLDGAWRSNQTGGYAATVWEMGETGKCFINTPVQAECDQGIGMLQPGPYHSSARESRIVNVCSTVLLRPSRKCRGYPGLCQIRQREGFVSGDEEYRA
jgi:hypothetical protein